MRRIFESIYITFTTEYARAVGYGEAGTALLHDDR